MRGIIDGEDMLFDRRSQDDSKYKNLALKSSSDQNYYFQGTLTKVQIVTELSRLLSEIDNEMLVQGRKNDMSSELNTSINRLSKEKTTVNNFSFSRKPYIKDDTSFYRECFHRDTYLLPSIESIRLSLIWLLQELSSCYGSLINEECPYFISDPMNILKPFIDTCLCLQISLSVCASALDGVAFLLRNGIINFNKRHSFTYVKNRITLALQSRRKSFTQVKSALTRSKFFASLIRVIKVIISEDLNSDIFTLRDLWFFVRYLLEFQPRDDFTTTHLYDIIDNLSWAISVKLKTRWITVEKLMAHNSMTSYANSVMKTFRTANSRIVRSCRSFDESAKRRSQYNNSEEIRSIGASDLKNLDPLTTVFGKDSTTYGSKEGISDKNEENIDAPHETDVPHDIDVPHVMPHDVDAPQDIPHDIGAPHVMPFDPPDVSLESVPFNVRFFPSYNCPFCDLAFVATIFESVSECSQFGTHRNARSLNVMAPYLFRILDQIIKHSHYSLLNLFSLSQRSSYIKPFHIPQLPKVRLPVCLSKSCLESNMDYFDLKKHLPSNMSLCLNSLNSLLSLSFQFLSESIFSSILANLVSCQDLLHESTFFQSPLSRVQITFLGTLFSSNLSNLLPAQLQWYLAWIIRNFDANLAIESFVLSEIYGENSRIYGLETRCTGAKPLSRNYHLLNHILDSLLVTFSNPNTSLSLYLYADARESSQVYILEDLSFFISKLCILPSKNEYDDVLNSIRIKCCRLLVTILHQNVPPLVRLGPSWHLPDKDMPEEHHTRSRKLLKDSCISVLNLNVAEGLKKLIDHKFLPEDYTEDDIAQFFHANFTIDRFTLWNYLSSAERKSLLVKFVSLFDFTNMHIQDAIRTLVERAFLSGEAQQISRLLEAFSQAYFEQNSSKGAFSKSNNPDLINSKSVKSKSFSAIPKSFDAVYILTYAIVILNTDLHNDKVMNKMKFKDFARNLAGMNDSEDFPLEFLRDIYDSIEKDKISSTSCAYDKFLKTPISKLKPFPEPSYYSNKAFETWSRGILYVILRPTLSVVYTRFKHVGNFLSFAYLRRAYIAFKAGSIACDDAEIMRAIICSLADLSGINNWISENIFEVMDVSAPHYCPDNCPHCGTTKSGSESGKKILEESSILTHFDTWSVSFGSNIKAQLAMSLLFKDILGNDNDLIRASWSQVIFILQVLFLHAALPSRLLQMQDLLFGETFLQLARIPYRKGDISNDKNLRNTKTSSVISSNKKNVYITQSQLNKDKSSLFKKDFSYFKNSISWVFGLGSYPVGPQQFHPIESSDLNIKSYKNTISCILQCQLEKIIDCSRNYSIRTLLALCKEIIKTSYVTSCVDTSSHNKFEGFDKKYHMAIEFNLNFLYEITSRNMFRCPELLEMFQSYTTSILLSHENTCLEHLLTATLSLQFSLISKILYHGELSSYAKKLLNALNELNTQTHSKFPSNMLKYGLHMVRIHPALVNIASPTTLDKEQTSPATNDSEVRGECVTPEEVTRPPAVHD